MVVLVPMSTMLRESLIVREVRGTGAACQRTASTSNRVVCSRPVPILRTVRNVIGRMKSKTRSWRFGLGSAWLSKVLGEEVRSAFLIAKWHSVSRTEDDQPEQGLPKKPYPFSVMSPSYELSRQHQVGTLYIIR